MPNAVESKGRRRVDLEFRAMREDDVDCVLAIERQAFPEPWPRAFFLEEIRKEPAPCATVVEQEGAIVGYLVAWFVVDEIHLGNLAVSTEHRRQGVASAMIDYLLKQAARRRSRCITLEVRAGNRAAISLYARHRFRPIGVRKAYYRGREDAILMMRELGSK